MKDVAKLWSAGYALGASQHAGGQQRPRAQSGPAFAEFVRHKVLTPSAIWRWPASHCSPPKTVRGGHNLNHAVLSALMADRSAWRVIEAPAAVPARRTRGHADIGAAVAVPAYGPEVS